MTITNSAKINIRIANGVPAGKSEGINGVISILKRYHEVLNYEYQGDDLVCKVVMSL